MNVAVASNAPDGAVIDVNGTRLFISQNDRHVPMLAEISVLNEKQVIGAVNTAKGLGSRRADDSVATSA